MDINVSHLCREDMLDLYVNLKNNIDDENLIKLINALNDNINVFRNIKADFKDDNRTSILMSIANDVFIKMLLNNNRFCLSEEMYSDIERLYKYELYNSDSLCKNSLCEEDATLASFLKYAYRNSKKRSLVLENILKFNISK